MTLSNVFLTLEQGLSALKAGMPHEARKIFSGLCTGSREFVPAWLGLAMACLALDLTSDAEHAARQALNIDPANAWARVLLGDCAARANEKTVAVSHYRIALAATQNSSKVPDELAAALKRASAYCDEIEKALSESVERSLSDLHTSPRFDESIDILFKRKHVYHSSPHYYHFPGLASISFHDLPRDPWLTNLEASTANIRKEAQSLLQQRDVFQPYIESGSQPTSSDAASLAGDPSWGAFYFWKNGERIEENIARCPETWRAIEQLPLVHIAKRSPSVLFSVLRPGAHIPPHSGLVNTRLIGHLPLIVPEGCEFRVGNDRRPWREGRAWFFDDSIEHEAWNHSGQTRVILLFEIWRPELTDAERQGVGQLFRSIDALGTPAADWSL